jgi:hypothetical protein
MVKDFKVMDSKAMLSRMTSKDFHPEREVLLEEEPPHPIPLPRGGEEKVKREKGVEFISESNNRVRLIVKATENTFLVLNDTYFPGWKAFVDGKETKIYRADYTFRAIPLNAGTYQVEFVYDPLSFKLGAAISILGIIGCIGICLIRKKPNNKKVKVEV